MVSFLMPREQVVSAGASSGFNVQEGRFYSCGSDRGGVLGIEAGRVNQNNGTWSAEDLGKALLGLPLGCWDRPVHGAKLTLLNGRLPDVGDVFDARWS